MGENELSATLCAAFGLPNGDINSIFVKENNKQFSLEKLCKSPSTFSGYNEIFIVLNEDTTDDEYDEEDSTDLENIPEEEEDRDTDNTDVEEEEEEVEYQEHFGTIFTSKDIENLVRLFENFAPSGELSLDTFTHLFNEYIRTRATGDKEQTANVLNKLFEVFYQQGRDSVNVKEFLSGLTVLCSGDRDEKIRIAFDLYDTDHNGFITLGEMTKYLTSVFMVIQQNNSQIFDKHGVGPEELANITAEQCFEQADLNRDGLLSYEEFKNWYLEPDEKRQALNSMIIKNTPVETQIEAIMGGLTGLSKGLFFDQFKPDEVFDVFSDLAQDGVIDRSIFQKSYVKLLSKKGIKPRADYEGKLQTLFTWLDQNNDSVVDFDELGSAVSVLCGGTRDDKVRAAFSLYDYNNDGWITIDEMVSYMTSVFTLLFNTTSGISESMGGIDPNELAELTAKQCFLECDHDNDGKLSFDEFREWYERTDNSMSNNVNNISKNLTRSGSGNSSENNNNRGVFLSNQMSLADYRLGLNELRYMTGVGSFNIFTIFDQFATRVDNNGLLAWGPFLESFAAITSAAGIVHHNENEQKMYIAVVRRLFDLFDIDGNGLVDFTELTSGLAVLCKNINRGDEKLRATFSLFDLNGDGVIEFEEMERYLTSLYKVMFEISHNAVLEANGLSPHDLAKTTTRTCFAEADIDGDGRLTFAEFSQWFLEDDEEKVDVDVREITGLGNMEIEEVFEFISEHIEPGTGALTRPLFIKALEAIAPESSDREVLYATLDRLFDCFDMDGNDRVSFQELVSGVSILCEGDEEEKAETAFQLYDKNGDGFLDKIELVEYLKAVFNVMYFIDSTAQARSGNLSAYQLATLTVDDLFDRADLNKDGKLSIDEFQKFFVKQSDGMMNNISDEVETWISIAEVKRITHLDSYTAEEAFEAFAMGANTEGMLDQNSFFQACHSLCMQAGGFSNADDEAKFSLILSRLFKTFDNDCNGLVDFSELSSGLSILCGGEADDKAGAAFALYDVNGDGTISFDELYRYLLCVFKVMYETQPGTKEQTGGVSPEELASSTAEKIFEEADIDGNGSLDQEEFRKWYSKGTGQQLSVAADLMAADPDWFNIDEIRRVTGIDAYNSNELLDRFVSAAKEDEESILTNKKRLSRHSTSNMVISRESFDEVLREFIENASNIEVEDDFVRLTFIVDRLYDMFDVNGDGKVDFSELSAGLSVLCDGSKDEKIESAFSLYDEDGDGFVSKDELRKYLTSVYKVIFATKPDVRKKLNHTSSEDLANATTEQCFLEADTNKDNSLSMEEFKAWVNGQGNSSKMISSIVDQAPSFVSMDEIKRITKIDQFHAEDIRDQISSFTSASGDMNKENFIKAFKEIAQAANDDSEAPLTQSEERRLTTVLGKLFNIFDTDSNGVVDGKELTSGLSILCAGDSDSKAQIAFSEFDYDGNNRISLEEMTRYLNSVFKIMYETKPKAAEDIGVDAAVLAKATADQIFIEADLDQNGELDFKEFSRWYRSNEGKALADIQETAQKNLSLPKIREVTRLGNHNPTKVFEIFASYSEGGFLTRTNFEKAFLQVVNNATPDSSPGNNGSFSSLTNDEKDLLHFIMNRLFKCFDFSGDGKIEFLDLVAGISVLCGGTKNMRAKAAFALYDLNQDNLIQYEEMESYLNSVFHVLFELIPGTKERMNNVDPKTLAAATTNQVFLECDLDHNGELSFDEFCLWYNSDNNEVATSKDDFFRQRQISLEIGSIDESSTIDDNNYSNKGINYNSSRPAPIKKVSFELDAPTTFTLKEIRRLSGLLSYSAPEAFELFAQNVNSSGTINEDAFIRVFSEIISNSSYLNPEEKELSHIVVHDLFTLFDQDDSDSVDFVELASGLGILCGGSGDDKAEAVFRLYDFNNTGSISFESMVWYLNSVFRLMYQTQPSTYERMGYKSASLLAKETAEEIFDEADTNKDGVITFQEFSIWYKSSANNGVNTIVSDAPSWISLSEIKRITGLENWRQRDIFEEFALAVDDDGYLKPADFSKVFDNLIDKTKLNQDDLNKLDLVIQRLFQIFDTDNNGFVDFAELASGLSILCKDDRDSKARAAFELYDEDGNGFIDKDELVRYLTSVFKVMYEADPNTVKEAAGYNPEQLAIATAHQIFKEIDRDGNGKIDFNEFKNWYSSTSNNTISPSDDGDDDDFHLSHLLNDNSNRKVHAVPIHDDIESPSWLSPEEVKRITGFDRFNVNQIYEQFATYTNDQGQLSEKAFASAFDKLGKDLPRSKVDMERYRVLRSRLFQIFDQDRTGFVDFCDIASGMTVLADADKHVKASSFFSLYDHNGDGYIQKEELERFLTCVFMVMFEISPDSARRAGGASPKDLGDATALNIMAEADLDNDLRLSFSEFKKWYEAQFDVKDIEENKFNDKKNKKQSSTDRKDRTNSVDSQRDITIDEARRVTGLENLSTDEVFGEFAIIANEDGMIDRHGFFELFHKIIRKNKPKLNEKEIRVIDLVLSRLYNVFDSNNDEMLDFSELCSGLSILTSGDRENKVKSAFALYDVNNDGFIDFSEMQMYLTSLFKVLFELMPSTKQKVDVSPDELALATTEQCFTDADLNGDGKLSFSEFNSWFSNGGGNFLTSSSNNSKEIPKNLKHKTSSEASTMGGLSEIKRLTKISNLTVDEVLDKIYDITGNQPLNFESFVNCFETLIELGGGHDNYQDQVAAATAVRQLFSLMDMNNDESIDVDELASGLSVLCKGSPEAKVRAAFKLFDKDGDNKISLDEFTRYLTSVFKVLYAAQPETAASFGIPADILGYITAEQAFIEADLDHSGYLDFEEFEQWYQNSASNQY